MSSPSRRRVLRTALGIGGAAVVATTAAADPDREHWALDSLWTETAVLTAPGRRVAVTPGSAGAIPGTRIAIDAEPLAALEDDERAVREAVEAAAAAHDLAPARHDLLLGAALDLHVLSAGLAAPVAAWSRGWWFVWPRDSAHVALAFARLGLTDRAADILRELARLCGPDGWFEARYVPGTTTPPDARRRQLDGTGWYLWALDEVAAAETALREEDVIALAARRCTTLLLELTNGATPMPPASPDYWERNEARPTIATCALVAVGLERGARQAEATGDEALAARARGRARELRALVRSRFGPTGYSRYAGRAGADAGMLFLLPPYALEDDPDVRSHLDAAQAAMARPAGGVAPGALWRRDGITWTPQTAMFAQATGAAELLDWLAGHRTASGSLPEKVIATGRPAAVAPLAWTAALVASALLSSSVPPDAAPARRTGAARTPAR